MIVEAVAKMCSTSRSVGSIGLEEMGGVTP